MKFKSFCSTVSNLILLEVLLCCVSLVSSAENNNTISSTVAEGNLEIAKELRDLSDKEKDALKEFRDGVYKSIPANLTIMRDDIYLSRFLRAYHWDVAVSKKELLAFLKFQEDEKVSLIPSEDWKDMELDYPFYYDSVDKEGRPIGWMSMEGGHWSTRKVILLGKIKRYNRYLEKLVLDMNDKLIEIRKTNPKVNQVELILDFNGFNLIQHGCPLCLTNFIQLLRLYERWIPGFAKDIAIINAPQSIAIILQTIRPVLSQETRSVLRVFNTDKKVWKAYLDERIDPSQLPQFLGGTRNNPE